MELLQFFNILDREEWKTLRATCREARAIADGSGSSIAVDQLEQHRTPGSAEELAAFVRGMLLRGARPSKLTLHPWVKSDDGTFDRELTAAAA